MINQIPMRSMLYLLGLMLTTLFISCNNKPNNTMFSNDSQNSFENILVKYNKAKFSYGNDIQKIEGLKSFDDELLRFIDSTKYFVNWKSKIKDIQMHDRELNSLKYKVLTFTLYYEPDQHREVKFECSRTILPDSLETDLLYNKIKNIENYSTVYFDGIIYRDNKGQIDYGRYGGDNDDMRFSYPLFKFDIFNITSEKRSDSISKSLKSLIDIDFKIISLSNTYKKSILDSVDMYKPIVDSLRKELTSEEIYWRNRFVIHYLQDLTY